MPFDSEATVEYPVLERLPPPVCETRDIAVAAPPEVGHPQPNHLFRLLPILTAVATVVAMAAAYFTRSAVARNPAFLMFPVMMLVSAVATVFSGVDRRQSEINVRRADFLDHLSMARAETLKIAAAQHLSIVWHHPEPDTLWTLVGGRRMWERRQADAEFCQVRIGTGSQPLSARLVAPTTDSVNRIDPVGASALQRFLKTHSMVSNAPVVIALRDSAAVRVVGDPEQARALLRAMICHVAVMHSPTTVLIAAAVTDRNRPNWEWLKWLPHNRHPYAFDDCGPSRMVYESVAATREEISHVMGRWNGPTAPQVVVVVDGECEDPEWAADGVIMLTVERRNDGPVVVNVSGEGVAALPDQLSYAAALVCAQRLAGYRATRMNTALNEKTWLDLVGIDDVVAYSPVARRGIRSLRVPVGTRADGTPVELDINEAAADGMGPHGLCIGATGSGKSEFLRTVALGMIVGHSSDELNLVLVDFKGGATFSGLEPAPHVAAVITNLSDKAALVGRMRDALMGEMNRRQEVLRAAGNLDGIAAYQRRRREDPRFGPLPTLFIIVDEFSELLSQQPDFADVFVAIGRLGRSLGVHLLLASQRLDEGRLRGLESHLSYRVCLKTLSVNESRIVLGTSEAYELPGTPGAAYLRVGTDAPVRFQTAFVSGQFAERSDAARLMLPQRDTGPTPVRLFTCESTGPVECVRSVERDPATRPTVLQAIIGRVSSGGPRAHEVWLPPLGSAPALNTVLQDAVPVGALTAPIGVVDRPFEQRRTPLMIDLSGAAGNIALVGAPRSGKSTALRTLITALAVSHDPRMVQFYCLDFGGGMLASLRDWPHVGSVAGRADPQRVRRTLARLAAVIRSREALFREHGIESIERYRQLKVNRDPLCDRFGDLFLIVDGWLSLQRELDTAEASVTALAGEGLSYGVHVVVSASRWAEIRPALRDQIGTRIELRLGDPADSELNRSCAQQVPEGEPGRGLTPEGLHMLIALPRLDGNDSTSDLTEAGSRLGEMLRQRHDGWTAPPIAVLPLQIEHNQVIERVGTTDTGLIVGIDENELEPLAIDFTYQLHLLVLGENECGKTATLRVFCRELLRKRPAVQLFIVDPRRSLLGTVEPEAGRLGGYTASADAIGESMPRLTEMLRRRMPPPNATPMQLRSRSWWSGPEIYVVVDDYDLLATTGGSPLAPLLEMLPYSRDLGLHLLVARSTRGAARAMFEPLLAGMRDAGCMTLLMSASPEEGLTVGPVRPSQLPPGRGVLITRRGGPQSIQVGWIPEP
ncbi:type VII secretion protein EccCa [Mycobacterium sp.]|uniref:type VII secretion protein EccCa n=1 Tax=Mycobacterium sp. TaxID=1785 RepID=UPI003D0A649A